MNERDLNQEFRCQKCNHSPNRIPIGYDKSTNTQLFFYEFMQQCYNCNAIFCSFHRENKGLDTICPFCSGKVTSQNNRINFIDISIYS